MPTTKSGTIFLPTLAACVLFEHELQGQFSDGMWENSRPHDHWRFWCSLDARVDAGEPRVESRNVHTCKKRSYNLAALFPIIGDRMALMGRMGRAAERAGLSSLSYDAARAGEYMLPHHEWQRVKAGELRLEDRLEDEYAVKYVRAVPDDVAAMFYVLEDEYTRTSMKEDVAFIKRAMENLVAV